MGNKIVLLMFFAILCFAPCCLIKPLEQQGPGYAYEIKYTVNGDDSLYSRRFYSSMEGFSAGGAFYRFSQTADSIAYYDADFDCWKGDFYFGLFAKDMRSDTSYFESGKYYPYKPTIDNSLYCNIGYTTINEGRFSLVLGPSAGLWYTFNFEFDVLKNDGWDGYTPREPISIKGSVVFTNECRGHKGNPAGYIVKK